jgi:hypothetical protein
VRPGSPLRNQENYHLQEVDGIRVYIAADFKWPEDGVVTIKLANYLIFKLLYVSPEAAAVYR